MIPPDIREELLARMRAAELEHDVRIVLAVESGSRAWGFASPNSDYDARFIYVNRPEWYLSVSLEEQRDVIEYPIIDDVDLNGWDLRKALRLMWKSNPAFVEWIQSPIVYREAKQFGADARGLLPHVYSVQRGMHHYRSMARTNYRGYLREAEVPLKKYFYVLRPLLSVRWLERYGTPAPIEFQRLMPLVGDDREVTQAIDVLLQQKRAAPELGRGPAVPVLQAFIERELDRLESIEPPAVRPGGAASLLNEFFRRVLNETWSPT